MKTDRPPKDEPAPRIVHGARILAALSVIWSGYAISDLMHSGPWGVTVAIAGDIGWITVLWAEANRVRIWDRTWPAAAAGWLIAVGVGVLLAVHGTQGPDGSWAKAMAGVLVIAVSKIVWMFALAATVDRTALTPEQEAEIDSVIRDSSYTAQLHEARADAEIARIWAETRTALARDDADFEVTLERVRKRAELHRRAPLALPPASASDSAGPGFDEVAEQAIEVIGEQAEQPPSALANNPNNPSEQIANKAATSPNPAIGQPSLADLVREQIAINPNNADAIRGVLAARPDANKESVAAAVRRERAKTRSKGGYA
ncbi:hypothetical protein [Streptomyces sp. ALI-76-A]|uniref:hypothetical protein n=1 Tax=Streptomyces sp. ALI-76-A TaxID=3025736 RepID=UPI00256ECB4F|nr:hypothetical protein [Streptomyces sp. ALI-76-A]MDL5205115.1 hypothetical protein [Streptomyces sp. ALI-76-A]